jgi:hypothetical protein
MIPAKADPDGPSRLTLKTEMEPRLAAAQLTAGGLFVDAAHLSARCFPSSCGQSQRLFIQQSAGRQRFNVLGALNAISHRELVTVTQR